MNYKNDKMNKIPPLQVGNDKLKKRFEWNGLVDLLVNKVLKITINW